MRCARSTAWAMAPLAGPVTATPTVANSVPTSADKTVTTNEDTAYTFGASDFAFTDTDSGDTLASVTVVTLPTVGTLALDGTDVTAADVVSKADIDDSKLVFTPAPNENGTGYASFTFKVSDGVSDESVSVHADHQRDGAERCGDGPAVDYGDGDGGPDADGGDVGDCGYRRQDEGRGRGCGFRLHLPVGAGGRRT